MPHGAATTKQKQNIAPLITNKNNKETKNLYWSIFEVTKFKKRKILVLCSYTCIVYHYKQTNSNNSNKTKTEEEKEEKKWYNHFTK